MLCLTHSWLTSVFQDATSAKMGMTQNCGLLPPARPKITVAEWYNAATVTTHTFVLRGE